MHLKRGWQIDVSSTWGLEAVSSGPRESYEFTHNGDNSTTLHNLFK